MLCHYSKQQLLAQLCSSNAVCCIMAAAAAAATAEGASQCIVVASEAEARKRAEQAAAFHLGAPIDLKSMPCRNAFHIVSSKEMNRKAEQAAFKGCNCFSNGSTRSGCKNV